MLMNNKTQSVFETEGCGFDPRPPHQFQSQTVLHRLGEGGHYLQTASFSLHQGYGGQDSAAPAS